MATPAKRKRIIALDILRGFFLAIILIDHLGLFPSPFELFTGRGLLWASAAEGFFLISGLLVGYVYAPRMIKSFRQAAGKIWHRAFILYLGSVILTWIMVALGHLINPPLHGLGLWTNPPLGEFLYKTITLQYTYGWADFLRYYAVYMAFAPLALWLCLRSKAWLVIAISLLVWLARGDNFYPAWQLLFMLGLVAGYYLPTLQAYTKKLSTKTTRRTLVILYSLSILTIIISALMNRASVFLVETYHSITAWPSWAEGSVKWLYDAHNYLAPLTTKESLEPLRLIIALLWFTAILVFVWRHEKTINKKTKGVFRLLGENSLFTYIIQSFIVYLSLSILQSHLPIIVNSLITLLSLVLIYCAVQLKRSMMHTKPATHHTSLRTIATDVGRVDRRTLVITCITLALLAGLLFSYRAVPTSSITAQTQKISPGEVIKDVTYCHEQRLDIYQPRHLRFSRSPVVMYIHGGGWSLNDKASEKDQLAMIDGMRDEGYAIVSIDYTKVPDGYYPTAVEESLCAVRFLRASADSYQFDSSRIAVYGFSAGGYLAAMIGSVPDDSTLQTKDYDTFSSRVAAVVTLAGLYDFSSTEKLSVMQFLNGSDPTKAEVLPYLSRDDPPFLLVHGLQDQYVPLAQDDKAAEFMEENGISVQRLLISNGEHGLNAIDGEMVPSRLQVTRSIHSFIRLSLEK